MRRAAIVLTTLLLTFPTLAGELEIKAAQDSIAGQLQAFQAGDNEAAYGYAAPNVRRTYPTLDTFMGMVTRAYEPVHKPQSFDFGKVLEVSPTSIIQQVMIVGPNGEDYEAVYTLALQPDGVWRITGISLRAANSLRT